MAITSYAVNDPLAVKLWRKKLSVEAIQQTWYSKFIGKDQNSLIQLIDNTEKSAGDTVTYGLRMQLQSGGTLGDGTLEGDEEALITYSDSVVINQLRNAVRTGGRMSDQRVPFNLREEARLGLQDWWAQRFDLGFFNQLAGNCAVSDVRYTGNMAAVNPDAAHILYPSTGGITDDSQLTSANTFNLTMVDYAKELAETLNPLIRPIMLNGSAHYVMFLHPYQVTDLRTNTSTGQWLDIQKAAETGGEITKNPIFTGALGVYNQVILHSAYRIPPGVNNTNPASPTSVASVRRAVFAGAQAGVIAFGRENGEDKMTWNEEVFDYGNQFGVSAGAIFAIKKTRYNSQDFGVLTVPTWAVQHSS